MKHQGPLSVLVMFLVATATAYAQTARQPPDYAKLPLSFEANKGQADGQVKYLAHGQGYTLFLTEGEAVIASPKTAALRMKFLRANPTPKITGVDEQAGKTNYFVGNDPKNWHSNVPTYAKVRYKSIYAGIDLVYYGNQRQLEYDFVVGPGADPLRIGFDIDGASKISRSADGDLVLGMGEREVRWHKPVVYQEDGGVRREIAGRYVIKGKHRVGFELARYDRGKTLFIDPVLAYSTYLGGSGTDAAYGIAVDSSGSAYLTGSTNSADADFPTINSLQPAASGAYAFVAKLNPSGSALVYSTYLGGSVQDQGLGIAVDNSGNAYITGATVSFDFPTMNPLQPANAGGQDAFVTELNPSGSALVFSTYLGGSGSEYGFAIAVDSSGSVCVIGNTSSRYDFPVKNPLNIIFDYNEFGTKAFVSKFTPLGSDFIYSTYLGGTGSDAGYGVKVDSSGSAYVTGYTSSLDFPLVNPFQSALGSSADAFVAKFTPLGTLAYSSYLGSGGPNAASAAHAIALDSAGNAYVAGSTSSANFPIAMRRDYLIAPAPQRFRRAPLACLHCGRRLLCMPFSPPVNAYRHATPSLAAGGVLESKVAAW